MASALGSLLFALLSLGKMTTGVGQCLVGGAAADDSEVAERGSAALESLRRNRGPDTR
jgi:hypothetical protein